MNKEELEYLKLMKKRYKLAFFLAVRSFKTFVEAPVGSANEEIDKLAIQDMDKILMSINWEKLEKIYEKATEDDLWKKHLKGGRIIC